MDSYTLFVGEGDFSYSANYILKSRVYNEKVFASCLNSSSLTERQQSNIKIIEENGGLVYTDVDATCLELHPAIKNFYFSQIVFNFPHIPGKMNIRNNRQLVQQFLISAAKILKDNGAIYVTLCQGQGGTEIEKIKRKWCDTWQIVRLAASASLILYEIKRFDIKEFETYTCTGFRGLQKSFNTNGALTHIFKKGKLVEVSFDNVRSNAGIRDIYLQNCIYLNKLINKNSCLPYIRVLSILNTISKKMFHLCDEVTIDDLFTCRNFFSSKSDPVCSIGVDYCKICISNLFNTFLKRKSSGAITSISCNLCCLKTVNLSEHPIHHLSAYFSEDDEALLIDLPNFLRQLNQVYSLNKGEKLPESENETFFHNKSIISTLLHNNQEAMSEKSPIRRVANVYAKYSIYKGDEHFFYSDVEFLLLADEVINIKEDKVMKVGTILQQNNLEKVTCILLNLDHLACLKYHIMDYRILLSEQSFYNSYEVFESKEEVYRSFSLYPPAYVHDTSFYIQQDFNENIFFMLVRNTLGFLIKSVSLIDSYYDTKLQKHSRCYQFVYQSCDLALTREKANEIHSLLMRKGLQNSLNVCLR